MDYSSSTEIRGFSAIRCGVFPRISRFHGSIALRALLLPAAKYTSKPVPPDFVAADMAIKLCLLFLEGKNKRAFFSNADSERPRQETSGIFNRSVFWWLNSLFLTGYKKVLVLEDLCHLDEDISSEKPIANFERRWESTSDVQKYRLVKAIVISLLRLFTAPVLPNLLVMGLTFTQPFLVSAMLDFIASSSESKEVGYLIVAGYAVVYVSKAICTAFYMHQLDRFATTVRGCLVGIIYKKTLRLDLKEAGRGESLTLMSADVEHIVKGFPLLHEISSNTTMTIIALGLLYRELGLAFIAPLVFSTILSLVSGLVAKPLMTRQMVWLEATEERVALTASTIASMKGVKILGLVDMVGSVIQRLRHKEVKCGKKWRIFYAIFTLLQTLSLSGTRWVTYTVFGLIALYGSGNGSLGVNRLFTSMAILNIFMERLEILIRQMPKIASAFGCIRRIEVFLKAETKRDNRMIIEPEPELLDSSFGQELATIPRLAEGINIRNLSTGWTADQAVLKDITLHIPVGNFAMITGPVGSGKSTLIQALLGETVTQKGFITMGSGSIAVCAQTPWLVNTSIQKNILGTSLFNGPWYKKVLSACALFEDLKTYPAGDRTLVGSKGITLSGGQKQRIALARAVYSKKPIMLFDDIFSGLDPVTEETIFRSLLGANGILRGESITVILATHAVHLLPSADLLVVIGESGTIMYQGAPTNLPPNLVSMRDASTVREECDPQTKNSSTREFSVVLEDIEVSLNPELATIDAATTDSSRQTGDLRVYWYYLKTMGLKHALLFAILGAICMGFGPAQNLWLNAWASDEDSGHISYYVGIYSIFFVLEILLTTLWIWHVLIFPLSASSIKLHDNQLNAALSATMAFYSNTDTGVTTNRFSQDLMLTDNELPLTLIDCVEYIYTCSYRMVLIGLATSYVAITFPFVLATFYFVQRFYLRTSRQIRFLDLETKSPLYTHFIETLAGLATLRGFGWEDEFKRQNNRYLQASQRPFFLLATIQRWLALVLNLIVSAIAIVVAIAAVELRGSIDPGFLGLALVNIMTLGTSLQSLVSFWTDLETSIGAVSRIRAFSEHTPSEDPFHLPKAPDGWLKSGQIDIKKLYAGHGPDSEPVLHDVNLSIAPGEHVGICGRSGSGKSSLLSTIFRIMDVKSGSIIIDGIDTSAISINQYRGSINALAQDAFFLPGTVRDNLISADSAVLSDEQLEMVLHRTGLWDKVQDIGGLDARLDAEASLSHGERQLFCLSRAMINQSRVLALDEFTSNVDIDTDKAMQKIIREDFGDRTILAVAHRLDTILDFDRIVVLDKGRVVEDGSPSELLSRDSAFKVLYDAYRSEKTT
ncbi:hypothetical protein O988_06581 [Pseudogymnoascus sp. VKM F-3808]|nr:hypothetical protein O988_06581 [Pseudogymnoascus sp. VKM F-3808]